VIFDEAHNLESFATESASFDLSSKDIGGCMNEVDKAITYIEADPDRFGGYIKRDNLLRLKSVFMNLEEYIMTKLPVNPSAYLGQKMMDIFDKGCSINFHTYELVLDLIKKLMEVFMEVRGGASKGAPHLEHFQQCVKRVFGEASESRCLAKAESYRVHVSPPQVSASAGRGGRNDGTVGRTVSYWCFAPSEAMRELQELNVRSILVTSGTLSPLESYALELDLPFPNRLENPHIISPDQIHVRVIGKGVSQKTLNSSYERRQDAEYYIELGNTLATLSRVIPMGMLVFFPSYGVMETAIERWGGPASSRSANDNKGVHNFFAKRPRKSSGSGSSTDRYSFPQQTLDYGSTGSTPWKRLLNNKAIIIEPRLSSDLPDAIAEFDKFLNLPKSKGVVLFGVCRGKISEGIDFAHDMCRAVIITGLPFAPSFDPKVKMKREFLDHNRSKRSAKTATNGGFGQQKIASSTGLSGHDWYQQQAHRAVNQAVGRVIRNKRDYGAVLLLDSRFELPGNQKGLSRWVRPHVLPDEGFGRANQALVQFYKKAKELETRLMQENPPEEPTRVARILEYENEGKENNQSDVMPDEEEHTKVAFIRHHSDESNRQASDGNLDSSPCKSYIPSQRIIATLDVSTGPGSQMASAMLKRDVQQKNEMSSLSMSSTQSYQVSQPEIEAKKSLSTEASITNKPNIVRCSDSCQTPAKRFFHIVQTTMSEHEVATIKKSVVLMKKNTQQKFQKEFLVAVRKVIEIILQHDQFLNRSKSSKPELLVLLLQLLPKHFIKAVKQSTMDLVFRETELYNELKAMGSQEQLKKIHVNFVSFLTQLWFGEDLMDERDAAALISQFLDSILKTKEVPASALSKMTMIVPREAQRVTNALVAEFNLLTPPTKSAQLEQQSETNRTDSTTRRSAETRASCGGLKQVPINPYARLKAHSKPRHPRPELSAEGKKRALDEDPKASFFLKKLLKQSESEIYLGKSNAKCIADFSSNAPADLNCTICDRHMEKPFISECGHMACYSCWDSWLRKTGTCAYCRKPVSAKSLALAIFQDS
jgi:DNA repair helicase Rad3